MLDTIKSEIRNQKSEIIVWDAFAGSGAFGIECLSRGIAKHVIFTDKDPEAIKIIKENLRGFDESEYTLIRADASSPPMEGWRNAPGWSFTNSSQDHPAPSGHPSIGGEPRPSLIFIDPPYDSPELGIQVINNAPAGCVIVWEMEKGTGHQALGTSEFEILKHKIYGRTEFLILEKLMPSA